MPQWCIPPNRPQYVGIAIRTPLCYIMGVYLQVYMHAMYTRMHVYLKVTQHTRMDNHAHRHQWIWHMYTYMSICIPYPCTKHTTPTYIQSMHNCPSMGIPLTHTLTMLYKTTMPLILCLHTFFHAMPSNHAMCYIKSCHATFFHAVPHNTTTYYVFDVHRQRRKP